MEDMKAAYGEPTHLSESDQVVMAYYEIEYATKEITFTFNENKLKEIRIINKDY